MSRPVTVQATVLQVEVDPELRDPRLRHLVRLRVEEVLEGELASDRLTLLVHSPSKTFADPDPVGSAFVISLTPPITDPYAGPVEVTWDEDG